MTFQPRMKAETRQFRTLRPLRWRRWPGVVADVWHVRGESGGGGFYVSPDPRVVVFLGAGAPGMALSPAAGSAGATGVRAFYVPAQVPLWSELREGETFSHLDLHLEAGPLAQRLRALRVDLGEARFIEENERIVRVAELIAGEVERPGRNALMVDGLLSALLVELFAAPADVAVTGGLAPRQRATVLRHMRQNLGRRVPVAELAETVGLSESWFARAFKASEGETVQRWQTRLRVEAAADLMLARPAGLAEIALIVGFADQAHLTRAFRAINGEPPARWRRERATGAKEPPFRSRRGGIAQEFGGKAG